MSGSGRSGKPSVPLHVVEVREQAEHLPGTMRVVGRLVVAVDLRPGSAPRASFTPG